MTLTVVLDDNGGMMFNKRRQSRDRALCENLLELCGNGGGRLFANAYSARLFGDAATVSEDPFADAGKDDFCFVENIPICPYMSCVDRIVIYRWNREYPSDLFFDADISEFTLVESIGFCGSSHERITREIYKR